jgi:hypothetical protein
MGEIYFVIDQYIHIDPSEPGYSQKDGKGRFPFSQFKTRDVFTSYLSKPQAARHFFLGCVESTTYVKKFFR